MSDLVSWCCGAEIEQLDDTITNCCYAIFEGETSHCSNCHENAEEVEFVCQECGEECEEIEERERKILMLENYLETQRDCELG
jgi:anaerobic ribonucleoside-triphosphate reductase|tara:strand:- start:1410 stop:1658 length:249 start_codon:yes stop_codon:yes gene_type:complete